MVSKKDIDFLTVVLELDSDMNTFRTSDIREVMDSSDEINKLDQDEIRYRVRKFGDGKHYSIDGKGWLDVDDGTGDINNIEKIVCSVSNRDSISEYIENNEISVLTIGELKERVDSLEEENEDLKKRMRAIILTCDRIVEDDFIDMYRDNIDS